MSLFETIRARLASDLKTAMKAKDAAVISAIRCLVAKLDNSQAVEVVDDGSAKMADGIAGATEGIGSTELSRRELADDEVKATVLGEIQEMIDAIADIGDRSDDSVALLEAKVAVMKRYLD